MPYFIDHELSFPHPSLADDNGLLAVGGDLSIERVLLAYQNGIFPWYEHEDMIFWFAPEPRWVIFPVQLQVHKSMRSIFNQGKFNYTLDTCFGEVVKHCATSWHRNHEGTWITENFYDAYCELHDLGIAHSVEVWEKDSLVGGLYGLSLGKIFFGESMFSIRPNASKAGLITLVRALERSGFWLVDCQLHTPHLESLGACPIAREKFSDFLFRNQYEKTMKGNWTFTASGCISTQ